jgi:DNA topoisomerase-1
VFDFPAKSGIRRTLEIDDSAVVTAVRSLLRRECPSDRFLVVKDGAGWKDVHADDLNARFKELVGEDYSVKDLRTWHGTVLAAAAFVDADPPVSKTVVKKVEAAVMKEVAEGLGNTPAVARASYVDPRVVTSYEAGLTIAAAAKRAARAKDAAEQQAILEKATRTLIQRANKS